MSCLYPMVMRRKASGNVVRVPCGQCDECLKRRSNEWGLRCVHELHIRPAIFVTLTYRDPAPFQLEVVHLQNFFKLMRKKIDISYMAAGEYGKLRGRPHFHMIMYYDKLLNPNVVKYSVRQNWKFGNVHIGTVTMRSAIYCAKYTSKDYGRRYYLAQSKHPPYLVASRGLGLEYAKQFISSWSLHGGINLGGYHYPIPRYYRKKLFTTKMCIDYNIAQIKNHTGKEDNYSDLASGFDQRQLNAEKLRQIKRGDY